MIGSFGVVGGNPSGEAEESSAVTGEVRESTGKGAQQPSKPELPGYYRASPGQALGCLGRGLFLAGMADSSLLAPPYGQVHPYGNTHYHWLPCYIQPITQPILRNTRHGYVRGDPFPCKESSLATIRLSAMCRSDARSIGNGLGYTKGPGPAASHLVSPLIPLSVCIALLRHPL